MQFAIDLPDELGQKLLQHDNVSEFIQEAIQLKLQTEEPATLKPEQNQLVIKLIHDIKPVKTCHSSIEMISMLRQTAE
jgi:hypothetical protein